MLLYSPKYIQRTFTAIFAQIWQQLTGMNVMMYYIVYIFQMAGYSGNSNLVASSIQYVINTCVTVPALYFIDKVGRRPLLIGGATMMMAFQFGLAGILGQYSVPGQIVIMTQSTLEFQKTNLLQRCHCLLLLVRCFLCLYLGSVFGSTVLKYGVITELLNVVMPSPLLPIGF